MILNSKSNLGNATSFRPLATTLLIGTSIGCAGFAQAQVTTFEHCDYKGKEANVPVGNFTWPNLLRDVENLKGDDISSIRVRNGYKATLYADPDNTGRKLVVTSDIKCLVNHNFNDVMSSIKVERLGVSAPGGNKVGAVTLPGKGASLEQVSDRGTLAWVWTKSSGGQVLYYENSRTADTINLQDANTRAKAKIDLKGKRFTTAKGHNVGISGTSDRPDDLRDMYVIEISGKIIAAYYADRDRVYGAPGQPNCSYGVDDAYRSLFDPACEVHDRYYNAPWELILNENWEYDFKYKDSADGNSALVRDVVESTFYGDMKDICDDVEGTVQIATGGLCYTAAFTWYNALRDHGTFYDNQDKVSKSSHYSLHNHMEVVYHMPISGMIAWMKKANKSAAIKSPGTEFEVEIDCNVSGADDETTNDTITVEFFNAYKRPIGKKSSNGVGSCFTDKSFTVSLNDVPDYFTVSTSGSDGYMIDEMAIRKNGEKIGHYGKDNDQGWCLSIDSADAKGDWANHAGGRCQKSYTFPMKGLNSKLDYAIRIDCLVSGADDEETSNRITVDWYSSDGRHLGGKFRNGISTCHGANDEWSIELIEPASYVTVSTNGSDGYLMDQIEMYIGEEEVKTHGGNDSRGWCLSTDNNDHNTGNFYGHSVDSQCPPKRRFNY